MQLGGLSDIFEPTLTPVLRLRPAFLLRDGIYSPYAREIIAGHKPMHAASSRTAALQATLAEQHQMNKGFEWISGMPEKTTRIMPALLLSAIGRNIAADTALLPPEYRSVNNSLLKIEGDTKQVYIHPEAQISAHAVINAESGPVVFDAGARIGAFSFVKGPVYVGSGTLLDNCHISNSITGRQCRLGGEIADSIIGDYSNKHHEGFLGHSIVGDWVNLGALTTTSDLKNNYGEVRLTFRENKYPTGTLKFGAIIGDYVKTAIGTMIGTGAIIDFGSSLHGRTLFSGYVAPFQWGADQQYDRTKFSEDATRMMQRRGQSVTPALVELFNNI